METPSRDEDEAERDSATDQEIADVIPIRTSSVEHSMARHAARGTESIEETLQRLANKPDEA